MKFISPLSSSTTLTPGTFQANTAYAVPIILREQYTATQAAMIFDFGKVLMAIYSDSLDYPGSMIHGPYAVTTVSPINSANNLVPSTVNYFDFGGSVTLGTNGVTTKYWLVCMSDSPLTSSSFVNGNTGVPITDTFGQGWDLVTQQAILGVRVPNNFALPFPSPFTAGATNIENQDFLPFITLGVS